MDTANGYTQFWVQFYCAGLSAVTNNSNGNVGQSHVAQAATLADAAMQALLRRLGDDGTIKLPH